MSRGLVSLQAYVKDESCGRVIFSESIDCIAKYRDRPQEHD